MSKIYMVSRVLNEGNLIGMGLLDKDTKDFRMVPTDQIKKALSKKTVRIQNVQLVDRELKGTNGEIERYPILDVNGRLISRPIITIVTAIVNDGEVIEFDVATSDGVITRAPYGNILGCAKGGGVSNAKVVNRDGKDYLASIKGKFDTIEINTKSKINEESNKNMLIEQGGFNMGFNSNNIENIRKEIELALKPVEEKYRVKFKLNKISYTTKMCYGKLECFISKDGKSPNQIIFEKYCEEYGLQAEDFGRQFKVKDRIFKLTGIKPNSIKRVFLGSDIETNKIYLFSKELVLKNFIE